MAAAQKVTVTNDGSRRVVIGPAAKSKGGGKAIQFDTKADEVVVGARRIGSVHVIEGDRAEAVKTSKVIAAMAPKLGLKVV